MHKAIATLLLIVAAVFPSCVKPADLAPGATISPIQLDDNSFEDWDANTDPNIQFNGSDDVSYGKFCYDADYVYFFVAMSTLIEGVSLDGAIMNLRIDADDNTETGMSTKSLGCDWYYEGNFWCSDPWSDWYDCSSGDMVWQDGLPIEKGTVKEDGNFVFLEFALSRKAFGITGPSLGLFFKFYTEDWDEAFVMRNHNGQTTMRFSLDEE